MIKSAFKLGVIGLAGALLMGCSGDSSDRDASSLKVPSKASPKVKTDIKALPKMTSTPQKTVSGSLVYLSFRLEKSNAIEKGWIIHDIDEFVQESHLNSADPELIVEFAFDKPLIYPSYYTSSQVSLQLLEVLEKDDIGLSLQKDGDQNILSVTSEAGQSNLDKWTFEDSANKNTKLLKMPLFTVDEIISNSIVDDNKSAAAKSCLRKKHVTEKRFYTAQVKLSPALGAPIRPSEMSVTADIDVCEGLFKKSQGLLQHNAVVTGLRK